MKVNFITILAIIILPVLSFSQCNDQLINMALEDNAGATGLKEFPVRLKKVKKKAKKTNSHGPSK